MLKNILTKYIYQLKVVIKKYIKYIVIIFLKKKIKINKWQQITIVVIIMYQTKTCQSTKNIYKQY